MNIHRQDILKFDTIILFIVALFSLEVNLPYALDQLNFHQAMPLMGRWSNFLCPGGMQQNLVLMGNQFMPYLLLVRTLTLALLGLWLVADLFKFRVNPRIVIIGLLILFHVIVPEIMLIQARIGADNHALAHDGGTIQMEESMKMVLKGQNPYGRTFHGTPLENWRGFTNNVIYHVPYMPGAFIFSIPGYLISEQLLGWYDQRMFHLFLYLVSLFCIGVLCSPGPRRNVALLVFALNPFFTKYFLLGANDIVIFAGLLTAMVLFHKKWIKSGFFVLAGACAVKQFAWFFVPFLAIAALKNSAENSQSPLKTVLTNWRCLLPGLLLFAILVLPFAVADFQQFYEDTFKYGSGGLPTSYPMQGFHGYGFASLVLFTGMVPDGNASFPFIIIQLLILGPLFYCLIRKYQWIMTLSTASLCAAVLLLVFMFFSRYLHGNFIGFIAFWPVFAWAADSPEVSD